MFSQIQLQPNLTLAVEPLSFMIEGFSPSLASA